MDDRVYWSVSPKKISDSFTKCTASGGVKDEDEKAGDKKASAYIITEYFGDMLLFACHEYMNENKMRPKSWIELFEFMKFSKTKGILKEMAIETAKAKSAGSM